MNIAPALWAAPDPEVGFCTSETTTMTDKQAPPPFHDRKKLRRPLQPVNVEHRKKLSQLERLAVWITDRVGTMGFFLLIFAWTFAWLGWDTLRSQALAFCSFP